MMFRVTCLFMLLCISGCGTVRAEQKIEEKQKPLFKDFMGLNTHTIQFKPDLYKPVCRLVRDYHGFSWDMGKDTDFKPEFPFARNRVNWEIIYGSWKKAGYQTDASIMFGNTKPDSWKNIEQDAFNYGKAFAEFFGPNGKDLVKSAEIGNEPGHYNDEEYRNLFKHMAKGLKAGDPDLLVATCAADAKESGKYHKSLECVKGLENLYDIINFHVYAQVEGWPTWKRSFPEDPSIEYLKKTERIIAWRDKHAPGKQIWLTEFGWDASTKKPSAEGTFKKWVGSTELEQARYLVRSFLVFSGLNIDRAYIFWFNDNDKPQVHGSSGLTRDYKPKPSFYAVSHLYKTLGQYRFSRIVLKQPGSMYVYEYKKGDRTIWAAWSPTGSERKTTEILPVKASNIVKTERMPLSESKPAEVTFDNDAKGYAQIKITESPLYIWLERNH